MADYISVNENASDPPPETSETDNQNTAGSLSLEATFVNSNFACQVVAEAEKTPKKLASRHNTGNSNPFHSPEDSDPLASCAFRYRKFDLSTNADEEEVSLVVRTEVDSVIKGEKGAEDTFVTVKSLLNGPVGSTSGGIPAVDWKQKLDTQRGAIAAMEMKNNSAKLARWAVQSILAGAEIMKMGCVFYIFTASSRTARESLPPLPAADIAVTSTFFADTLLVRPPRTPPATSSSAPRLTSPKTSRPR
jgi:translation initiation factor 3 subunit D